ncbi:hypothetical protein F4775DRAFT_184657 [Biscogniauxia sp. FL1348]|nr:hypothetical protein F4775DRAFT_184657 [Biscogniauxia sp. FL1348]
MFSVIILVAFFLGPIMAGALCFSNRDEEYFNSIYQITEIPKWGVLERKEKGKMMYTYGTPDVSTNRKMEQVC